MLAHYILTQYMPQIGVKTMDLDNIVVLIAFFVFGWIIGKLLGGGYNK